MKLTNKIQNIISESRRLEREAYAVAQLASPENNDFIYCFHNSQIHPSWSVWPHDGSYDGPKHCEIKLINRELKVSKEKGFTEKEIEDITLHVASFLDED